MSFCKIILSTAAALLLAATTTSFAEAKPADAKASAWPTEEGVPVNQWYMRTTDADGTKLRH
jgi:hypothetical protein